MRTFNYKVRATLFFSLILFALATIVLVLHRQSERTIQEDAFYKQMENYADIIDKSLNKEGLNESQGDSIPFEQYQQITETAVSLFPSDLRVTIILASGKVLFDNEALSMQFDSHRNRSEILQAWNKGEGKAIRQSASLKRKYCYYAKRYMLKENNTYYYIRTALPYEIHYSGIFHSNKSFVLLVIILFALGLPVLLIFTGRISNALQTLQHYVLQANKTGNFEGIDFPKNEIGDLSREIKNTFVMLQQSKNKAQEEREKLLSHFSHSGEGIAFFNEKGDFSYANSHFIRHLNKMVDEPTYMLDSTLLKADEFAPLRKYLATNQQNLFRYQINKDGAKIEVRAQRFPDNSFEIVLSDITQAEENRRLKHEMTNSIAHELRTPVTSIRGYIETLLENPQIDEKNRNYFLERSYTQLLRLSELISDITTLTKLEEATELYPKEQVNLGKIIEELKTDLEQQLQQSEITLESQINDKLEVYGNASLLYTIFRNLVENSIKYAGNGAKIEIYSPMEDKQYQYFIVADNGPGVPSDKAREKLFDRFYRVSEGRSRADGGSGLGLSIVKNAVLLHGGTIQAKQRTSGGLEIFFSLEKQ